MVAEAGRVADAPAIRVRPAAASDIDAMLPLIRAHAEYERSVATTDAAALQAALAGPEPRLHAWLAAESDMAVGYAAATRDFATWAGTSFVHLDCLFVREAYRGHGIGLRLLEAVRAHAAEAGAAEMRWQTPEWNEGGRRFYLRAGAQAFPQVRFVLNLPERRQS